MRRERMRSSKDRHVFSRTAHKVHPKNVIGGNVMRGGIRM